MRPHTATSFGTADALWEFTDTDLGQTLGKPVIVKMNTGEWAVIIANGYNSTNEKAFLFVLNLNTGALIKKIATGAGSGTASNGLGSPVAFDQNGDITGPFRLWRIQNGEVTTVGQMTTADVDAILAAVTPKTRIVFLANPNNPTGTYLPVSEVRRLQAGLPSNAILVIDAAYAEYVRRNDYESGLELGAATKPYLPLRVNRQHFA